MKTTIYITLATLVLLIAILYIYNGGLTSIKINQEIIDEEILVYKEIIGDYKQTATIGETIQKDLKNNYNITAYKGFDIYYDDPQQVEKSKLRSEAGCILQPEDTIHIKKLQEKYKIKKLYKEKYITSEFPFKSKLSILIGMLKTYPKLKKYIQENQYPSNNYSMEIYDSKEEKITYRYKIN